MYASAGCTEVKYLKVQDCLYIYSLHFRLLISLLIIWH